MMKLVVGFDELEIHGDMQKSSQKFREKMLTEFLQDQFPAWDMGMAFGAREWDFVNSEVHVQMVVM